MKTVRTSIATLVVAMWLTAGPARSLFSPVAHAQSRQDDFAPNKPARATTSALTDQQLRELIKQLSDDELSVREAATRKLLEHLQQSRPVLRNLLQQHKLDAEATARARLIVEQGKYLQMTRESGLSVEQLRALSQFNTTELDVNNPVAVSELFRQVVGMVGTQTITDQGLVLVIKTVAPIYKYYTTDTANQRQPYQLRWFISTLSRCRAFGDKSAVACEKYLLPFVLADRRRSYGRDCAGLVERLLMSQSSSPQTVHAIAAKCVETLNKPDRWRRHSSFEPRLPLIATLLSNPHLQQEDFANLTEAMLLALSSPNHYFRSRVASEGLFDLLLTHRLMNWPLRKICCEHLIALLSPAAGFDQEQIDRWLRLVSYGLANPAATPAAQQQWLQWWQQNRGEIARYEPKRFYLLHCTLQLEEKEKPILKTLKGVELREYESAFIPLPADSMLIVRFAEMTGQDSTRRDSENGRRKISLQAKLLYRLGTTNSGVQYSLQQQLNVSQNDLAYVIPVTYGQSGNTTPRYLLHLGLLFKKKPQLQAYHDAGKWFADYLRIARSKLQAGDSNPLAVLKVAFNDEIREILVDLTRTGPEPLRLAIAQMLVERKDPVGIEFFRKQLQSKDISQALQANSVLVRMNITDGYAVLIDRLNNDNNWNDDFWLMLQLAQSPAMPLVQKYRIAKIIAARSLDLRDAPTREGQLLPAIAFLRKLSGLNFGFRLSNAPSANKVALEKWIDWARKLDPQAEADRLKQLEKSKQADEGLRPKTQIRLAPD